MSPARHISKEQPVAVSIKSPNRFTFPNNSHLLITTPSQISAWDSSGIHTIFQSRKNGIVAAREAQDGSGILAVADKHVVVLHDTNRGQEQSWGLEASEDEVRHLEYTADAKSLFLSTRLTTDIQRYSTERARLLSLARAHASPPVALAVSPTGHFMVSASDCPPVVYLNNLAHNTAPVLIEPRATKAAVSVAAFHPDRPNIFLLAFRDGTIAAYDSTKVIRCGGGSVSNQENVNKGEISHLTTLHRAAAVENKRAAITDAAFLPGFVTRAVSVGSDGRCRLLDFAGGGVVLRTWHAKAPVTSVSVFSLKIGTQARNRSAGSTASHVIGGPTSTDNLIAVGRADGLVHIYDSVGLLLSQRSTSENGEKIISVEWARGPSPKPIVENSIPSIVKELPHVSSGNEEKPEEQAKAKQSPVPNVNLNTRSRRETLFEHVGLPPELRKPKSQTPKQTTTGPPRKFTIHPDEIEEGTVRHTPLPQNSKPPPTAKGDYLDLFSPVKPAETKAIEPPEKRIASPPRSRPAITSQTFAKSPEPARTTEQDTMTRRRNLALFPSTDSGSETAHPSTADTKTTKQAIPAKMSPPGQKKHITFKDDSRRNSRRASSFKTPSAQPNNNAKVLADLRKMGAVHPAHRPSATLSSSRPAKLVPMEKSSGPGRKEKKLQFLRRPVDHIETHHDSDTARKVYEHSHERRHWPEDSNQDASLDGDIWLTSESNEDMKCSRRRKQHIQRPPARQTSRSRVTSKGTTSTLAQQPADVAFASAKRLHRMDGSTEEDMFTADTHVTSSGTFSPSSKDVRELFPRSSSLSPRKRRKSEKRGQRSPEPRDRNLREIVPNEAAGRFVKSPWERARAGKVAQSGFKKSRGEGALEPIQVFEDPATTTDGQNESPGEPHCAICGPTKARVQKLEAEVARLKGEVLVFKAVLRRQGVPLPSSLR